MNENEQIEEMAELVYPFVDGKACEQESGSCEFTTCRNCNALNTSKTLYSKGYRKVERGEWSICGMFDDFVKCTVCGDTHPMQTGWSFNFCPNCGTDMRGERDEEDTYIV